MKDGLQEIQLESARIADAACLAEMSRSLVERGLGWRWTPHSLASKIRDPEAEVVVARKHGKIIGFAVMQFRFAQREAHLLLFAVVPPQRRRGLGRALLLSGTGLRGRRPPARLLPAPRGRRTHGPQSAHPLLRAPEFELMKDAPESRR